MKFEVDVPSLSSVARVEIRVVREGKEWAAYLSFVSDRILDDTCLMLGRSGIPHHFSASSERAAAEAAKKFLEENYHVVRTIW